jgi:hypothetical protein
VGAYLEKHRRNEGAYGWSSDATAQLTPTFAVVGSYRLLGRSVPDPARIAAFVRTYYPAPEVRRTDRPLWRLDFEQVQTLRWLDAPVDEFRQLAATWVKPADFTTRYELDANPVLQHQAMAVRTRRLLGFAPGAGDQAWRDYFLARRRANGTFNNTPASDGSGGHIMNTLWGLLAAEALDLKLPPSDLAGWVAACQLPSGGFTYAPKPELGGVDDIAYTWCALQILERTAASVPHKQRCGDWIESLLTPEGGFQDRPEGEPNPLATFYALDCLRLLDRQPSGSRPAAPTAKRHPVPDDYRVFSIQIEGPGEGSPRDAVLLANTLGIHIWAAKNSPPGWVEEARKIAKEAGAAVEFMIGNEEHNTYLKVDGLGCYSHLVDIIAPYGADTGERLPPQKKPYDWSYFHSARVRPLQKGGGRLIWQFNENEEISRVLLDDAIRSGAYSAIASYHFGRQNFIQTYPFLHRWYGRLPFIGLQDVHSRESWWWGNQLAGYTTLFLAKDATWESWLEALDKNWVMAVRHDAVTGWKTHLSGGSPEVRAHVMKQAAQWCWWDDAGRQVRRPAAALTLLRPGMRFEAGAPSADSRGALALRLRLWHENSQQGRPLEPHAELVELQVDGQPVKPALRQSEIDRYFLYEFTNSPGPHRAEAAARLRDSGRIGKVSTSWRGELG